MVDISGISAALGSLTAAKDIAQAMIGLRDAAAFQSKLIEFQSKIIDAQNSAMAANDERALLLETIRNLEEKMSNLKAWEAEKQKYSLKEVDRGAFACALKENMQDAEPVHWLCTKCYGDSRKAILQSKGSASPGGGPGFRDALWKCFTCNSEVITRGHISPASLGVD